MARVGTAVRAPAIERRVGAAIQRRAAPKLVAAAPRSPAQALRQRLGNQASGALVARATAAPPAAASAKADAAVQRLARVSSPGDPAEREAHETARKVMRMAAPAGAAHATSGSAAATEIHRAAAPAAPTQAPAPARADTGAGAGAPLPAGVREYMEPRFDADFSEVRVHADELAARRSEALNAHAFTEGRDVYFGRGRYQPDTAEGRELIAHELTHTIQQGAAAQGSTEATVTQRAPAKPQRLGLDDVLDYIADKANYLPGFRLLTIVLGMNPVNFAPVERSAANLLRALLELIPITGALIAQALENYGLFARVGAWVEAQVRELGLVGSAIKRSLDEFIDSLGLRDIFSPGDVWERGKRIFTDPIGRLLDFGRSMVGGILDFIREAILLPLAVLAEGTRGYPLLKAVLGEDPITGQAVPRTAENLIGGFMRLIGQEEIWQNIQKADAVPRAWAWFQEAYVGLIEFVRQIPTLFMTALRSLELTDLLLPPKAFIKLVGVFGGFVGQFVSWAGAAVWKLLEIIFEVVSPGALAYIKKTGEALWSILKNPLPFVLNLVRAAKLGFENFAGNFVTHLKAGLIDWLVGSLPGVYIPKGFTLGEFVKFVFSVLGLTWENIRPKLVKVVGETAVKAMETGFEIVVTLVTKGPAAAWEQVKEQLSSLKDQVIGGIIDFVVESVVKKAVPKLIAMFIPGAGFISAIISIYDTIMVFVDKLARMVQVVKGFVDSIVAIAAGEIAAAAKRVETSLASVLSLAISFLAGFVGLGDVAEKVMGVIQKIRGTVDKAIDALIAWIVKMAKTLFRKAKGAAARVVEWWKLKQVVKTSSGDVTVSTDGSEDATRVVIAASPGVSWAKYVAALKPKAKGDPMKEQALNDAKPHVAIIESKRKPSVTPEDHMHTVDASLNALARYVKIINEGAAGVPVSVIKYGGVDSLGGGREVRASPLSKLHPKGSEPSDAAPIWTNLAYLGEGLGRDVRNGNYVRGHLLNENLGGPGSRFNLTPITTAANNKHKSAVEKGLKDLVNNQGEVISYTVVALPAPPKGSNPRRKQLEARTSLKPAENRELKSLIALQQLTRGFKCTAFILKQDPSTNKWTKKGKALDAATITIENNIQDGSKTYGY